jgi:hypothetical protein
MPNTRISALTAAVSVAGTDVFPSVQTAGVGPVKTSLDQIKTFTLGGSGTLPVANGGTGLTSLTANYIPYGNGTSAFSSSSNFTWNGSTFNISSASAFMPQILNFNSASDQYGPYFLFQKSRGASAVQVNDFLGTFVFKGYDSGGVTRNSSTFYASVTAVGASSVDSALSILSSGSTGYLVLGATSEAIRFTTSQNALLGITSNPTTGTKCLTIGSGTAPTASPADSVTFYSSDLSAGNTMLSYYTEGTSVNANTTAAATHRIAVRVNGTVYYILANTSA